MKSKNERLLPLNPDVEKAALNAVIQGKLTLDHINPAELSKLGKYAYQVLESFNGSKPSAKGIYLTATEVHGADPDEFRPYLKEVVKVNIPQISVILDLLSRKQIINRLVNEATDQIASGDYSLLGLKGMIEQHGHANNTLVPLCEDMKNVDPPQGIKIPSLPSINEQLGGQYGLWVVGGEPGTGKSTLSLQIACSINRVRPVLYYDFEQGKQVIKWHINKAFEGNRKRIKEATQRLYIRSHINLIERDLDMIGEPCLVVVDSIQKVTQHVTFRRESLESWIHKLEALKRYGHHVILVSEINRDTYGDARMDGYKETGELEFAADAAMTLLSPDEQDRSRAELHITKNRHYKFLGMLTVLQRVNSWWFRELKQSSRELE